MKKAKNVPIPRPTIHVSQNHIDSAIPKDSGHCMIADAIKTAIPDAKHISVDIQSIRWTDPKKNLRYVVMTPRPAQIGLVHFDQGHKIEPFSFSLKGVTGQVTEAQCSKKSASKTKHATSHAGGPARFARRGKRGVPDIIGGQAPPRVSHGERREFGVRAYSGGA